jgi:hypothetical protein
MGRTSDSRLCPVSYWYKVLARWKPNVANTHLVAFRVCLVIRLSTHITTFSLDWYRGVMLGFVDVFQFWIKYKNKSIRHMKTYMRICAHLDHKSLKIYRRENCFHQTLHRKLKLTLCVQYSSSVRRTALEIINKAGQTRLNYYTLRTFPNFLRVLITRLCAKFLC